MQTNEALSLIKQVMDAACKAGILQNLETAAGAATAFNIITQALQPAQVPKQNP